MNLTFTEEQNMMRKMVRDFAQNEVAPAVEKMDREDEFPTHIVKKMGELGLMGIPIPEEYGGAGMDFTSYIPKSSSQTVVLQIRLSCLLVPTKMPDQKGCPHSSLNATHLDLKSVKRKRKWA